ncbi:MAG: P-loop NTPase fold protein [Proteobacteria bacterium]|nr:P-loop NTPase fold protein [Pseudomonadota bacterium]
MAVDKSAELAQTKSETPTSLNRRWWIFAALVLLVVATPVALLQSPRSDVLAVPSGFDWFFRPWERNAFLRLPEVGGQLNDVAVVRAAGRDHIWAVGNDGFVLHSPDGGRTWKRQSLEPQTTESAARAGWRLPSLVGTAWAEPGTEPDPPEVSPAAIDDDAAVPDPEAGGGETEESARQTVEPEPQTVEPPDEDPREPGFDPAEGDPEFEVQIPVATPRLPDLRGVAFVDERRGWVVGARGLVMATQDGGTTWQQEVRTGGPDLFDVFAFPDGRVVAVGTAQQILVQAEPNARWESRFGGRGALRAVAFTGDGRGVAVGEGQIVYSPDRGESWAPAKWRDAGDAYLNGVALLDDGRGVAVGEEGRVYVTDDAGRSWTRAEVDRPIDLFDVVLYPDGRGWAIGVNGQLATEDAGRTWQSGELVGGGVASSALGPERAYVVGNSGLRTTDDAGATWTLLSRPVLSDVALGEGDQIWVVGDAGALLESRDRGRTWEPHTVEPAPDFYALERGGGGNLEAVGGRWWLTRPEDGPAVVGQEDEWRTTGDVEVAQGRTWALAPNPSGEIFRRDGEAGEGWRRVSALRSEFSGFWSRLRRSPRGELWAAGSSGLARSVDGGERWTLALEDTQVLAFDFAGDRAIAIGDDGEVLTSPDGGDSWTESASLEMRARDLAAADPERWIAVGRTGAIATSANGGESWTTRTTGIERHLFRVDARADGLVVAVGVAGAIVQSEDYGASWSTPAYVRLPAPWYLTLIALVVGLGVAGATRRPEEQTTEASIADVVASDRPLRWRDADPLGFHDIAKGLSRFLRNARTQPPLTVAVTGEWGTGKSSLMGLLSEDLRRRGFRPVWFNAWHHQKGEHLLASLFANIRAQAIPGWFTPEGLRFRTQLLLLRGPRQWLASAVLLFAFVLGVVYFGKDPERLANLLPWLTTDASAPSAAATGNALAVFLGSFLVPGLGLLRAVRAFGLDPSRLVNAVSGGSRRGENVEPGARFRFASEFADVTQALRPRTLVIFIDDLDRCSKEHVVEILEAVNFLVTSGDCFVVFGMAREWVTTCVALQFRELSSEGDATARIGDKEREFARQYLEKLINIEVPVPPLQEDQSRLLLKADDKPAPVDFWKRALQRYGRPALPWAAAAGVLAAGWSLAQVLPPLPQVDGRPAPPEQLAEVRLGTGSAQVVLPVHRYETPRPSRGDGRVIGWVPLGDIRAELRLGVSDAREGLSLEKAAEHLSLHWQEEAPVGPTRVAGPTSSAPTPRSLERGLDRWDPYGSFYAEGETDDDGELWGVAALGGLLLAAAAGIALLRRPAVVVEDSPEFTRVLDVWHPWIVARRATPRAIKRYLNRVRYLAMRQRRDDAGVDPPFWRRLWHRWREEESEAAHAPGLTESALVALSAIHHVDRSWVETDDGWERLMSAPTETLGSLEGDLLAAVNQHRAAFGWPIPDDSRQRYLRGTETVVAN